MFTAFLICAVPFLVVFGLVIFLVPTIIAFREDRKKLGVILILAWLVLSLICGWFFLSRLEDDFTNWNDGYCPNCGEEWRLLEVERAGRWGQLRSYIYICDNCGKTNEQLIPME